MWQGPTRKPKLQEKGKENNSTYLKSSKNEEDNVEIDNMFDDETMAAKINNDNDSQTLLKKLLS